MCCVPPVREAGALTVLEVRVADGRELLEHLARMAYGHILVGFAVQNVNALLEVVLLDAEDVVRAARAQEYGFGRVFGRRGAGGGSPTAA